ncbi:MAG: carbohydrate kinase family protein [Chlamydiales bacterium]|nr:carbohydrate kinase family protein [Chlamydiales bacterium]
MMQKSATDPSSLKLPTASEIFKGVNDNPYLYIWNRVDNGIVVESLKLLEGMSYSDSTLSKFATDFEHANIALECLDLLHSRLFYSYNPEEKPSMRFSGNQVALKGFLDKFDALDSLEELIELYNVLKNMPRDPSGAVIRFRDHNVATDKFLGLMDDIRSRINSYGADEDALKSKQLAYLDEIVINSLFYKTSTKMKTRAFKTVLKDDASIERAIDKAPKRAALIFMALAEEDGTIDSEVQKRLFTDISAGMKLNIAREFKDLRSQYPKYFSLEKIASTFIDDYSAEEVLTEVREEVKAAYQEHISAIDRHGLAKFAERLEAISNLDTLKALKSLLESRASDITIISPLQLGAFEILEDLYLSDGLLSIAEKKSLKTSMDSSILEHFKGLELDKKDPYQEVLKGISQDDQKVAIARYAFSLADVEGGAFPTTQKLPDYDNLLYAMNLAIVIKAVSQRGAVSSKCQAYVDKMKEEVFSAENKIPEDIADERLSDICSYGGTNEFLQALPDLLGSDAISEDSKGKLKAIAAKLKAYLITEGSYRNLSKWADSDPGGVDDIVETLELDRLENFQKLQVALSLYENRAALGLDFPGVDTAKIEERRRELLIALPQVGQSVDRIKNDYKLAYNMFAILNAPARDRESDFETIKAFVAAYHELELSDRAIIAELLNPDTQDGSIEVSYHLREWLEQNCPSDLVPVHEKMKEKMTASVEPFESLVPELQAKLGGNKEQALEGVTLLQTKAHTLNLDRFLSGASLKHGFDEIADPGVIFDFLQKFNEFKSLLDSLDKGKSKSVERAVYDLVKEEKSAYEATLELIQESFNNVIIEGKDLPSNHSSDRSRKAVVVALLGQEYPTKEEFLNMYDTLCAAYSPVEDLLTPEGELEKTYLTRDKFEALVAKLDGRARRRGFIKNELNSLYDRIDEQSSRIKLENQLKAGLFSGVSEYQLTALLAPFLGTLENRETLTKILDYLGSEEGVLASDLPALSVDQLKALSALLELNTQEELKQRKNDLFAALFEKIQEDRSLTTSLSSSTRKHSQFTDNKFLFVLAHLSSKDPSFHGLLAAKLSANSSLARSWDMELGKLTEDLESGESKLSERDLQKVTDLFTSFALLLKGNAIPDGYTEFEERLKRGTGEEKAAGSFLDARSGFEAEGGLKGQIKWMEQEDREFVLTCLMAANESEGFKLGDLSHIDTSAFDSNRVKALIEAFNQSLSVARSKADDGAEGFLQVVLQKLREHFLKSSENINELLAILKPDGARNQATLLAQLGGESAFSTSLGNFKYQLEFLALQDGEDQSYYMVMQQALQASTAEDTTVDKVRFTRACLTYVKLYDHIAVEFPSDNKDEVLEKFQAVVSSFQEQAVDLEKLEELLDAAPDNKIEFNLSLSQALSACRNITSFDSGLFVENLRARMEVSGEAFPKLEEDYGANPDAMRLIEDLRGKLGPLQLNTLNPASEFDDVKERYDDGNFEGHKVVNFLRHYADIKKLAAYIASEKKVNGSVWNTKKSTAERAAVDAVAGDIQAILGKFDENYRALKEKLSDAGLTDFAPVLDSLVALLESIDPSAEAESNANSVGQFLTLVFDLYTKEEESNVSFFKGNSSLREHFKTAAENDELLELEDKYLLPLEYGTFKGKLTSKPISLKSSNKFLGSLDADYNYFNNTIKAKERLRSFCELPVVKISSASDPAFNALIDLCFDHPDRDEAMMEGFSDIVEFLKDTSRELDLKAFHGTNLWEALPHIINLIKDPTAKKALIDKYIAACASIGERAARSDVKNFKKEFGDGESAELEQSIKLLHFLGSFKDTTKKAVLTQQMLEIFPEFSQNIQKLFTESLSPIIFKKSDGTASSKKPSDGLVVIQGEVVAMQTSLIQAKLGAISGIDEVIDPSKKANLVLLLKEGNSPENIQAILQIISDPTEENLDSLEITPKTLSILLELRSFVKDSKRADFIKVANKYIEQSTSPSYSGNEAREAEFGGYYKQCLKELFDGESPAFFSSLQTDGNKETLANFYTYLIEASLSSPISSQIKEKFEERLLLAYGASIPAALDFIDGTNPDPNSFVLTDEELKDEELFPIVLSLSKEKCDKDESFTELNALRQGVIDGNITVADIKAGPESALRFHLAIDNARKELREHGLSNEEDLKLFSDKFRDGLETHPDKELITDCTLTRPGGEKLAVPRGFINTLQLLDDALHDHSIAYQGGESTATAITAYFGSLKDRVEEESELKELQSLENEDLRDGVTASMLSSALEAETIDENVKVAFLSLLKNNAIDLNNPSCIDELKVAIGDNPGNQKAFINYYISLLTKTAGRNKTHELAKALQKPMQHLLKAWDNESALEVFLDAFKSNNSDSFKVVGSITEGVIRERPIFSGASEEALNDLFQITSTSISRQKDTLATLERFTRGSLKDDFDQLAGLVLEETNRPKKAAKIAVLEKLLKLVTGDFEEEKGILEQLKLGAKTLQDAKEKYAALASEDAALTAVLGTGEVKFEDETAGTYHSKGLPTSLMIQFSQLIDVAEGTAEERSLTLDDSSTKTISKEAAATFRSLLEATLKIPETNTDNLKTLFSSLLSIKKVAAGVQKRIDEQKSIKELIEGLEALVPEDKKETDFYRALQAIKGKIDDELKVEALTLSINIKGNSSGSLPEFSKKYTVQGHKGINKDVLVNLLNSAESESRLTTLGELFEALGEAGSGDNLAGIVAGKNPENSPLKEALDEFRALGFKVYRSGKEVTL